METVLPKTFIHFLRQEFTNRTQRNPRYSLRSFASFLGVSPSGLSMILSGKTAVTLSFIEKTAKKLQLSPAEIENYQMQILKRRTNPHFQLKEFEFIDAEKLAIIKEWYHYAILNLMRTKGFQAKEIWIARRLGLSLTEVQSAVENLQRVGLLSIKNGKWIDTSNQFTSHTNNKKFNEAARINQLMLFDKAMQSIENDSFQYRNHTGSTIALSLKDLEQVKEFITAFRKDFISKFDKKKEADEVYHLSVGLFPLSKLIQRKERN